MKASTKLAGLAIILGVGGAWYLSWSPTREPLPEPTTFLHLLVADSRGRGAEAATYSTGSNYGASPSRGLSPWASNLARWQAKDISGLLRDARRSPASGSFYFGYKAARYCAAATAKGDLPTIASKIREESAANPAVLKKRLDAARAWIGPCEGMSFREAMALSEALLKEGDSAGDVRLALSRRMDQVLANRDSTASEEEKTSLVREAVLLGDPDALRSVIGAFGPGSVVAGYTLERGPEGRDRRFETVMLLALCGSYGECDFGPVPGDQSCALQGQCDEVGRFGGFATYLNPTEWARTYALYVQVQGALGARDASAFLPRLPSARP